MSKTGKPASIRFGEWVAARWKAIAGVASFATAEAVRRNLLPETWRGWASLAVAVAVFAGIYVSPANETR